MTQRWDTSWVMASLVGAVLSVGPLRPEFHGLAEGASFSIVSVVGVGSDGVASLAFMNLVRMRTNFQRITASSSCQAEIILFIHHKCEDLGEDSKSRCG
jgi:hypothetical protein